MLACPIKQVNHCCLVFIILGQCTIFYNLNMDRTHSHSVLLASAGSKNTKYYLSAVPCSEMCKGFPPPPSSYQIHSRISAAFTGSALVIAAKFPIEALILICSILSDAGIARNYSLGKRTTCWFTEEGWSCSVPSKTANKKT